MPVGVLALQGAVSEHFYHLQKCGVPAKKVRQPQDLEDIRGLIIPGGESTTIGLLLVDKGMDRAIKERSRQGMALFGTCAGMVLMAGEVEDGAVHQPHLGLMNIRVRRNAFGRQKESFETDVHFKGLHNPFRGVFIRAPLTTAIGTGVEELARIDEGIVAARQGNILVTSFHPELTDDIAVHRFFLELCT